MTQKFFDEFPVLWDAFEKQLKEPIIKGLAAKVAEEVDSNKTKLSSIYRRIGSNYWWSGTGAGYRWKTKLEEVFFEYQYFDTIRQLNQYYGLDDLVDQLMEGLDIVDARELYRLVVKPLLDEQKQMLMAAFAEMKKELDHPLPYKWKLSIDGHETSLTLGFRNRYKKGSMWKAMDGYTYTFNGRTYKDIQAFRTPGVEKLSEKVSIAQDTFGEMVLRRYTEIPTFDSGDREWNSEEIEYLMFDGKDINLIAMGGGYRIAYLIFFEKLLTADARMKPIFEKLGWPINDIAWT